MTRIGALLGSSLLVVGSLSLPVIAAGDRCDCLTRGLRPGPRSGAGSKIAKRSIPRPQRNLDAVWWFVTPEADAPARATGRRARVGHDGGTARVARGKAPRARGSTPEDSGARPTRRGRMEELGLWLHDWAEAHPRLAERGSQLLLEREFHPKRFLSSLDDLPGPQRRSLIDAMDCLAEYEGLIARHPDEFREFVQEHFPDRFRRMTYLWGNARQSPGESADGDDAEGTDEDARSKKPARPEASSNDEEEGDEGEMLGSTSDEDEGEDEDDEDEDEDEDEAFDDLRTDASV